MTKKDYEKIAGVLKHIYDIPEPTWKSLVYRIANVFAEENPRFNRQQFYRACGRVIR